VERPELHEALFGRKGRHLPFRYGVHGRPPSAKLPRIESGEEVHGRDDTDPALATVQLPVEPYFAMPLRQRARLRRAKRRATAGTAQKNGLKAERFRARVVG
jgi:hypothetical protein